MITNYTHIIINGECIVCDIRSPRQKAPLLTPCEA